MTGRNVGLGSLLSRREIPVGFHVPILVKFYFIFKTFCESIQRTTTIDIRLTSIFLKKFILKAIRIIVYFVSRFFFFLSGYKYLAMI